MAIKCDMCGREIKPGEIYYTAIGIAQCAECDVKHNHSVNINVVLEKIQNEQPLNSFRSKITGPKPPLSEGIFICQMDNETLFYKDDKDGEVTWVPDYHDAHSFSPTDIGISKARLKAEKIGGRVL